MGRKLTEKECERYRALLLHIQRELAGDIGALEADAFSNDGTQASVDNPADAGSDSFAQEFSLELLSRDEDALGEVAEALERIEQGIYGKCQGCEVWIPRSRLSTVPHARRCVSCQRALEEAR